MCLDMNDDFDKKLDKLRVELRIYIDDKMDDLELRMSAIESSIVDIYKKINRNEDRTWGT